MKNVLLAIAYPFVWLGRGVLLTIKYVLFLLVLGVFKLFGDTIDID